MIGLLSEQKILSIYKSLNSLEDISAAWLRNFRKWSLTLLSELEQLFVRRPLRSPGDGINLDFRKKERVSWVNILPRNP